MQPRWHACMATFTSMQGRNRFCHGANPNGCQLDSMQVMTRTFNVRSSQCTWRLAVSSARSKGVKEQRACHRQRAPQASHAASC